jgi:hypothetical protein
MTIPAPSVEENTATWTSGRWLRMRAVAWTPSSEHKLEGLGLFTTQR